MRKNKKSLKINKKVIKYNKKSIKKSNKKNSKKSSKTNSKRNTKYTNTNTKNNKQNRKRKNKLTMNGGFAAGLCPADDPLATSKSSYNVSQLKHCLASGEAGSSWENYQALFSKLGIAY